MRKGYLVLFGLVVLITLINNVNLNAELKSKFEGQVLDKETGKGIKGVLIRIVSVNRKYTLYNKKNSYYYQRVSDKYGNFVFPEVVPDEYTIAFIPPSPYLLELNPWKTKIKINSGKIVSMCKEIEKGGAVEVKVIEQGTNKPMKDVDVTFYYKNPFKRSKPRSKTNKDGKIRLDQLAEGTYKVLISMEGYGYKLLPFLIEKKKIEYLNVLFDPNALTRVTGYIKCKDTGNPLINVHVIMEKEIEKYSQIESRTDENGYFSFIDLEPGDYIVQIYGGKYSYEQLKNSEITHKEYIDDEIIFKKKIKVRKDKKTTVFFNMDCSLHYETMDDLEW